MSPLRTQYKADFSNVEDGVALARSLYSKGDLLSSIDIYEQLLDGLDAWSGHHADIILGLLAEVRECLTPYWQRDRYTLYQSRFYDFAISEQDKVLDIGSGDRPFPLATHLADISLLDGHVGRAGMPFKYVAGKPLYECSIENLPFADNEFDFVYCSHVLEHVSNPEKACSELMRIARRGFIETPTAGKDLFLNYAKISNHRWGSNLIQGVLQFSEYSIREINGLNCNIVNEMHEAPETQREKALSALFILKADLLNNMLLWEDRFNFEVIRKKEESTIRTSATSRAARENYGVSVIVPTFNRAAYLSRAVKSIQNQSTPVSEIIVVDDNSSDQTEQVVQDLMAVDSRIKYVRHERNLGAQAARNSGIHVSTGEWIAFLDSDDEFLPDKIEKQMEVALREKVVVVHSECYVKRNDKPLEPFGTPALSGNVYKAVLTSPGPTFPALLVKKSALEAIGLLDQEVPSFQEWDTAIRLAKDNAFCYVPEPLFIYHCHDGETISKDMKRHTKGYAYIVEKHAIDILRYGGTDALLNHYRSLIQQAIDYDLPTMLQLYKHKFIALNGVQERSEEPLNSPEKGGKNNTEVLGYISAKETVEAAKSAGLSVCDYVEKIWDQQGCTQLVIDQMGACGVFAVSNPNILEIGAGTGRYLEKVFEKCTPANYESYETAKDWAAWLQSTYPVISHRADGMTLSQTPSHSVDILHAHGVFVYLPFLVACRYWKEMWRVVKIKGYVVFDVCSEGCFDEYTLEKWLASQHNYPCFLSRAYIVSNFEKHGFSLQKVFKNRYGAGYSEYLVFVRER